MYANSVVIGSLAVLLLICFLILQAYCFNNSATSAITPDGTLLSGREAITFNQSVAQKYTGDFTDDTIAKMVLDYSTDYPAEYAETVKAAQSTHWFPQVTYTLPCLSHQQTMMQSRKTRLHIGTSIPPLTGTGW